MDHMHEHMNSIIREEFKKKPEKSQQPKMRKIRGKPGEQCWIEVDALMVDHEEHLDRALSKGFTAESYQRDLDTRPPKIAANWDWDVVGVCHVAVRNGDYYVVDGRHTVTGAKMRPEIKSLPCYIISTRNNREHEAQVFIDINTNRKAVTPVDRLFAGIIAKDPMYLKFQRILKENGFRVVAGQADYNIRAIGAMVAIERIHEREDTNAETLYLIDRAFSGDVRMCTAMALRGVASFVSRARRAYQEEYDIDAIVRQLHKGGADKVMQELHKMKVMQEEAKDKSTQYALAMAKIHDYRRRNKKILKTFRDEIL